MYIGQRVMTSLGEVIVLDIKNDYLILMSISKEGSQFIKANIYNQDHDKKVTWNGGEYYSNLDELIKNLD